MLNWQILTEAKSNLSAIWHKSGPTKHVVIENLLEDGFCERLYENFSVLQSAMAGAITQSHKNVRGKAGTPRKENMAPLHRQFFEEINSQEMCKYLETMTGIAPLIADDDLMGGGLHETRSGGFLRVHTDFNMHPKLKLNRRLNLLLYLNPRWDDAWNGHIELWDEEVSAPYLKLQPIKNRALIFETNEGSYHGHPHPLKTPTDLSRRSMAVYYYSDWPNGVIERAITNYQLSRQEWANLIGSIATFMYDEVKSQDEIVDKLELDYQTDDIKLAYRTLLSLRSPTAIKAEPYFERADGTVDKVADLPAGFNSVRYLELNPDVAAKGADAAAHYRKHGYREGRRWR